MTVNTGDWSGVTWDWYDEASRTTRRVSDYFPTTTTRTTPILYGEWVPKKHEGPRWFFCPEGE